MVDLLHTVINLLAIGGRMKGKREKCRSLFPTSASGLVSSDIG